MALMICGECGGKVSDKASMCVHCGCPREFFTTTPTNSTSKVERVIKVANTKPKRKYMKMPNGYGHIKKLSGNRRKPWAAYPPRRKTDYDDYGKELPIKAIGYFKTRTQAETALFEYRAKHGTTKVSGYTFKDMYEKFIEDYKTKNVSQSAINSYIQGFNLSSDIHNLDIDTIRKDEMQNVIDNCDKSHATKINIKKTYNAIFKYMIANGLATINYAQYVEIKTEDDTNSGTPLTIDELKIYYEHRNEPVFQIAWILLLSGMRISELKVTKIDLEEKVFIGGLKTKQGKERTIPMHPFIVDYVTQFNQKKFSQEMYRKNLFLELQKYSIAYASDGQKRTPHDFRHTFSWLADKYKMDDICKRMIIGHSLGSDVDKKVYTHRTLDELKNEILKIDIEKLFQTCS